MWTYAFLFRSLIVGGDTWLPYNASVMFSTRRTETPARNISMRAFSTRFPCGDTAPWSPFQKKSPWVRRLEHDISRSGEVTSVVAGSFVLPTVYCRLYPYGLTPTSSGRRAPESVKQKARKPFLPVCGPFFSRSRDSIRKSTWKAASAHADKALGRNDTFEALLTPPHFTNSLAHRPALLLISILTQAKQKSR